MKRLLILPILLSLNLFGFVYSNSYYNFKFNIPDGYFNTKPIIQDKDMIRLKSIDGKAELNIDAQRLKKSISLKELYLNDIKYFKDRMGLKTRDFLKTLI